MRLNKEKAKQELFYEKLRGLIYSRGGNARKGRQELIFDVIRREKIAEKCRLWVVGELARVWSPSGLGRNPWHPRMEESMFWM
jgi:hypothetical protein